MLNVHELVACALSVAVHRTVVVPTGNSDEELGLQLVCTGMTPPATTGNEKRTAMPLPVIAVTVWFVGQVTVSAGGRMVGGGVGWVGVDGVHPASTSTAATNAPHPPEIELRWGDISTKDEL
jgi:hypothetical protein